MPVLLCLALVLPTSLAGVATLSDVADGADALARTLERQIVGFHEMPSLAPGDDYAGARVVSTTPALRFAVVETDEPVLFETRARLDENVRYVERDDPEFGRALLVPNDAQYNNAGHWGSKKIGAEAAWSRTLGSTSVKVAVIDSGLRKTHEEFAASGRVLQGWDFVNNDNNPEDNCGHGTHTTGTIGATINNGKGIAGLAQVTLLPIRGLSATLILCSGSTSALANALAYAGDQGAHFSSNSWGGGGSTSITDAINYAHGKGVIHVAAAGNDGSCSNCVSEPWKTNAAKVIIVSSTTSTDGFSSFSSEGPQVDVSAPGSGILSSYNSNDASYSTLDGTSMATPHVTGAAALIKTLKPTWGYTEIDNRLKTTAVDRGAAGFDNKFGYGRINADAATAGLTGPNNAPTASFTYTTSGLTVNVNGAGSSDPDGDALTYSWNWGDGTAAGSGVTASHAYASAGTRTVTLTVNDGRGGSHSQSQSVTVTAPANPPPTACFTHSESGLTTNVNGGCSTDNGSVTAWSWNWGDGTPAGSGSSASHAYATSGTYTVTLTVTDNQGATGTTSQSVTVTTDPDPGAYTLTNGVAKSDTISGAGSEKFYKILVPAGKSSLSVVLDGPACGLLSCNPDLDLYVKRGSRPTDSSYDCRPYTSSSDETCTLSNPAGDWWYVRVIVYSGSASGSYTVRATYT